MKKMNEMPYKPWSKVVELRDDVRTGELSLNIFAADLYDVVMGRAPACYQNLKDFFSLTYPTFKLRELAKDVVARLEGKSPKAVRQLELTYGGGKTHTLITLYHLMRDPASLPNVPAVQEFLQHIGIKPKPARIAVIPFDKLDMDRGMEITAPDGSRKRFRYPWTVLAFQVGGLAALKALGMDGDAERETPPFENVLEEILRMPQAENLSTLILIDEVLMWVRTKIGESKDSKENDAWRNRVMDFFQCLTQAATKITRCCIVASLLATDPKKSDKLGKEIAQELYSVFRRESEEGICPVEKVDVSEILRRRFFTIESIQNRDTFRAQVSAILIGIKSFDDQVKGAGKQAEDRFLNDYPFHPDLIDIFYTKWTNLEGFQKTRGVLRTFAIALRQSEKWDTSPLICTNIFLCEQGSDKISDALRDLTNTAAMEEYEGKKHEWTGILEGELKKARKIQDSFKSLKYREIEQSVIATFLHSQPFGQKAQTRDLFTLIGYTRPDKIELEKALQQWTETSWFLDENLIKDTEKSIGEERGLPKYWRLGSRPNIVQMHHDACGNIPEELVKAKLMEEIQDLKSQMISAVDAKSGVKVHNLPLSPRDVLDDGDFHFVILPPAGASSPGKPSGLAKKFINESTSPERHRVYRNAVVIIAPSTDGLDQVQEKIQEYLGWEDVRAKLNIEASEKAAKKRGKKEPPSDGAQDGMEIDAGRKQLVLSNIEDTKRLIPDLIKQSYCVFITVSKKNEIEALKLTIGEGSIFSQIKADSRSRIQDAAISAEALLPSGPYELWRGKETSKRVKDLVFAFAQHPHLPKMLNRRAIAQTLVDGCKNGFFVLRQTRPDLSIRTVWFQQYDDLDLKDPSLEVILPQAATLTDFPAKLLFPDQMPGLWKGDSLVLKDLDAYFAGGKVVTGKFNEPFSIPKIEAPVLHTAVKEAIKEGMLLIISGNASFTGEDVQPELVIPEAALRVPPELSFSEILSISLPAAWRDGSTNTGNIQAALSLKLGYPVPWTLTRKLIDGALRARVIEMLPEDLSNWPCDVQKAATVRLRLPEKKAIIEQKPAGPPTKPPATTKPHFRNYSAEAAFQAHEIQDLAEKIGEFKAAAIGLNVTFTVRVDIQDVPEKETKKIDDINSVLKKVKDNLQLL